MLLEERLSKVEDENLHELLRMIIRLIDLKLDEKDFKKHPASMIEEQDILNIQVWYNNYIRKNGSH